VLNGINVIETIVEPRVPVAAAIFMTIICAVVIALVILAWIQRKRDVQSVVTYLVVIACCIIGTVCIWELNGTIDTTYRVQIDQSVSFVEFNEHYEIISQNGDEYIIAEKAAN
jgi:hypothetical protein